MKKIFTILSVVGLATAFYAQNLVTNPSFDTGFTGWAAGFSTNYYAPAINATDGSNGTNSAQYIDATATTGFYQNINVTAGTTYTISFWYKSTNTVNTSDVTNARIWSYWLDSADAILTDASTDAALRGPNNSYLTDAAAWTQYTATVVAPAGATKLQFAVRTYSGGTTSYDDFSLTAGTLNVNDIKNINSNFVKNTVVNANLYFGSTSEVKVYNMMGKVVKTAKVSETQALDASDLQPGMYIVTGNVDGKAVSQKVLKK